MESDAVTSTVVIMAGGTGGHIFPALATALEFKRRGFSVQWIGTEKSMEAEIVPRYEFPISFIPVAGIRRNGIGRLLKAPYQILLSVYRALKILRREKPILVLGMGGFATGPGGVAARILGIPLVIHEQNAIPGLTNRILSYVADCVLEAFPDTFKTSAKRLQRRLHVTGNPIRTSIKESKFYNPQQPLRLLVLGGSRGAVAINQIMPEVIQGCKGAVTVWHQAGKNNIIECQQRYDVMGVSGRVDAFIDDMAEAYKWADVVLCRAGALTVSELAMAGRPAILIPYPYAVDDHQTRNGNYLVKKNAALLVQQSVLSSSCLVSLLLDLSRDPQRLKYMAASAKSLSKPMATADVVDYCLGVCHG
ncbi:UDP-N-acetylglucosamine--N-acetylmuramyl-(pentapeptide) pyrophosphoryl-undecaprenol N-acetylglucosamine transferase [invertebrate metagenome]|uniref:UDP-N-acetylglucosamine--N-acetylmuramyl-(Pentapeptide) pyrophosphoryl-undecaprenol N-acetylglucosamine transferase n=1 Tax=invertebrate metagenome TaxID=1711999 RepID=A0A2H9TAU8_9ZZZZ